LRVSDLTGNHSEIAVIAAGIIFTLDAERPQGIEPAVSVSSNWKKAGRDEGLR